MATLGKRSLGRQGLTVSALGLGCVGISELYGPRELDESRAMLQRALELGVDFFDTSEVVPIPGTKRRRHLEENVAAAAALLGPDEVAAIRAAIPRDAVAGARYADDELGRVEL